MLLNKLRQKFETQTEQTNTDKFQGWKELYKDREETDSEAEQIRITNLIYKLQIVPSDMIIGSNVLNDLEVIHPYDNETYKGTLYHLFKENCDSTGGKLLCKELLINPICNEHILQQRIECLKKVEKESTNDEFIANPKMEQDLLWFFDQKDQTILDLLNTAYINLFGFRALSDKFNNNECALTCYNVYKIFISPSIGVLSPMIYVIIPFFIIKYKLGNLIKMSFTTYLKLLYRSIMKSKHVFQMMDTNTSSIMHKISILSYIMSFVFYFQGLFNTFSISKTTYKVIQFLSQKVLNAVKQVKYYRSVVNKYKHICFDYTNSFITNEFPKNDMILLDAYISTIHRKNFTILSNFGSLLKFYKFFPKDEIMTLMNKYYFIDSLLSMINTKRQKQLCYVTILKDSSIMDDEQCQQSFADTPQIEMRQAWHICIDPSNAVPNDISTANIILTGPNAGGKSTLIKTLCTNILLAQSIGLNASKRTELKPFYFINTQINVPDCKGVESLFEAEMNRCMFTLNTLKRIQKRRSLIVMDEIFNSTNMIEAVSGAYSILHELSKNRYTMIVITTHFIYLTKLRKTSNFVCKKMNVDIVKDDSPNQITMKYPYTLKNGISRQYIALDLLRNKGFDTHIIEQAIKIKDKFATKPDPKNK
jgi:hypothetical protein